jgi:hypothetical protein
MPEIKPARGPIGLNDVSNRLGGDSTQLSSVRAYKNIRAPLGIGSKQDDNAKKYSISISGHSNPVALSQLVESDVLIEGAKLLPAVTWYDYTKRTTEARKSEAELGGKGFLDKESEARAKRTKKNLRTMKSCDADIRIEGKRLKGKVEEVVITVKGRKGQVSITRKMDLRDRGNAKENERLFQDLQALTRKTAITAIMAAQRLR